MQSCINYEHCWGLWRTCTICTCMVVVSGSIVDYSSLCASGISISFGASASCVVISGISSPLGGEGICGLWLGSNSSLLQSSSSFVEDSGCCSWGFGFGTSIIMGCSDALGSRSRISKLGLGDSLVICGGCHSSVSGWLSYINSEAVV
jgi:hypothetical protein